MPRREDVLEFLASELDVDTNWLRGEESTTQLNSDASNSVTDGEHAATPLATVAKPQTDSEIPVGRRRTFGKSHKLDNVLYDVRGPVADEADAHGGRRRAHPEAEHRQPGALRLPHAGRGRLRHGATSSPTCEGYSPSQAACSPRARPSCSTRSCKQHPERAPSTHIYTGNGVSELINLSMSALLDDRRRGARSIPGLPAVDRLRERWPAAPPCTTCATSSPNGIRTSTTCRNKITEPHQGDRHHQPEQPHRRTLPDARCSQQIVDIAREHQLIIFSGRDLRPPRHGRPASTSPSPRWRPDLFVRDLLRPVEIAHDRRLPHRLDGPVRQQAHCTKDYIEGLNMLSNMRMCSNVPAQSVVQTALGGHQSVNDYIVPGGRVYDQRDLRLRHAQPDPRHHRRQAQGRVLHLPEDRRQEASTSTDGRAVRARPAA